jgi:archaellum component FlaD/FlaE
MAINQAQVDHIISTASADDPEVRMQRLQDDVDLIKKSIKKLLIDIRDRMNELENPFVFGSQIPGEPAQNARKESVEEKKESDPVKEPEPEVPAPQVQPPQPPVPRVDPPAPMLSMAAISDQLAADEHLLRTIKQQMEGEKQPVSAASNEKLRLQKIHRLFDWAGRMVKKYGHDRLEIMIESYTAMGYISKDACAQIKEITRLMPESLGESHEISSNAYVSELYVLNRILDPGDSSLDRDMIEVLMDKRQVPGPGKKGADGDQQEPGEDWIDMLERI